MNLVNLAKYATASVFILVSSSAYPHKQWSNGEPIEPWVAKSCCGQADAHKITDESIIHELKDGIHIDGYEFVIPYNKVLPSPDGSTWIFYMTFSDGTHSQPFCFFRGVKGV